MASGLLSAVLDPELRTAYVILTVCVGGLAALATVLAWHQNSALAGAVAALLVVATVVLVRRL